MFRPHLDMSKGVFGLPRLPRLLVGCLVDPFGGRGRTSGGNSLKEFSICSDIDCLVGLEGGKVHHNKSEFDLLVLFITSLWKHCEHLLSI